MPQSIPLLFDVPQYYPLIVPRDLYLCNLPCAVVFCNLHACTKAYANSLVLTHTSICFLHRKKQPYQQPMINFIAWPAALTLRTQLPSRRSHACPARWQKQSCKLELLCTSMLLLSLVLGQADAGIITTVRPTGVGKVRRSASPFRRCFSRYQPSLLQLPIR